MKGGDRLQRVLERHADAAPGGGREAVLHPPFHVDRRRSRWRRRGIANVDLSQKRVVDLRDANPRAVMDINLNEVRPNGVRHNRQA